MWACASCSQLLSLLVNRTEGEYPDLEGEFLQVGGLDARRTPLLCKKKKNYSCEIERSGNRIANPVESSKESYVSKRVVLPKMMTMILRINMCTTFGRIRYDIYMECSERRLIGHSF
jgi:hypothetical protein